MKKAVQKAWSPQMMKARTAEAQSLLNRQASDVVAMDEIPEGSIILPGRFVMFIKSSEDGIERYKTRYAIGGHRNKLKNVMVHSSQTLQPSSTRLLLALASLFDYEVRIADIL